MVVINNPAAVFFDETPADPGVDDCRVVEDMVVLARVILGLLLDEVAGTWIRVGNRFFSEQTTKQYQ